MFEATRCIRCLVSYLRDVYYLFPVELYFFLLSVLGLLPAFFRHERFCRCDSIAMHFQFRSITILASLSIILFSSFFSSCLPAIATAFLILALIVAFGKAMIFPSLIVNSFLKGAPSMWSISGLGPFFHLQAILICAMLFLHHCQSRRTCSTFLFVWILTVSAYCTVISVIFS